MAECFGYDRHGGSEGLDPWAVGVKPMENHLQKHLLCWRGPIVDGSEIRRSPVEVGSLSHYLRRVLALSQVIVWDFFHQQYVAFSKKLGCFFQIWYSKAWYPENMSGKSI